MKTKIMVLLLILTSSMSASASTLLGTWRKQVVICDGGAERLFQGEYSDIIEELTFLKNGNFKLHVYRVTPEKTYTVIGTGTHSFQNNILSISIKNMNQNGQPTTQGLGNATIGKMVFSNGGLTMQKDKLETCGNNTSKFERHVKIK